MAESKLATAKTVFSTVASVAATTMVIRSLVQDYMPPELHNYLFSGIRKFLSRFSNELTIVIDEFDGLVTNEIYEAAECYLGSKINPTISRLKIGKPAKEDNFNITMEKDQEVIDLYNDVKLKWIWVVNKVNSSRSDFFNPRDMNSTLSSELRSFELTFHKKYKDIVINSYLPYIIREAELKKHEKKTVKIHTINLFQSYSMNNAWMSVKLDHPANFDTLAMDSEQKDMILKDLEMFVERKEHYRRVGKAWKRGYLLYGPPGTGKSSLVAAMANFLNFDIYDLELTGVRSNSELRSLLLATANKSIMVVEDIDCTIELEDRLRKSDPDNLQENNVTLSGFLNFIDGLWSSCGDERIIVFTTNHREKLDPALLRPGRMDVHIHMSYCTPCGFRLLANNYLQMKDHFLFKDVEKLIEITKITPAEVAEQLLKHNESEASLRGLIGFLQESKRKENEEAVGPEEGEIEPVDKGENSEKIGIEEVVEIKELISDELAERLLELDEAGLKDLIKDLADSKTLFGSQKGRGGLRRAPLMRRLAIRGRGRVSRRSTFVMAR